MEQGKVYKIPKLCCLGGFTSYMFYKQWDWIKSKCLL